MRAGELRERITFLRRDLGTSSSGSGYEVETFVPMLDVRCRVQPLSGSERFASATRFESATHSFRMRYRTGVDPTWRIEWRGVQFDITAVLPGGQGLREWLDIVAQSSPAENPLD